MGVFSNWSVFFWKFSLVHLFSILLSHFQVICVARPQAELCTLSVKWYLNLWILSSKNIFILFKKNGKEFTAFKKISVLSWLMNFAFLNYMTLKLVNRIGLSSPMKTLSSNDKSIQVNKINFNFSQMHGGYDRFSTIRGYDKKSMFMNKMKN